MVRLKHALIVSCLLCGVRVMAADPILFDFNDLGALDGAHAISVYMSDIYGSSINVDGARTTPNTNHPPTDALGRSDRMIATSFQLLNRGDFDITFQDQPIIGLQFEGHVLDASPGEDFHLTAYNGDTVVYELSRSDGAEVFDSGLINLTGPVDHLHFSDSGRHDVGIDDLRVVAVPEPATGILALMGIASLLLRRAKRAA